MAHPGSSLKFSPLSLSAVVLPICIALLAGCGSKCPSGFTEQDDGSCLRNHYGGTDNGSDDTGGDDTSADDTGASAN